MDLMTAVADMVSSYQQQNLGMAINAEVSKKTTDVAEASVLKLLEGVSTESAQKAVVETIGKGATLNLST